MLNQNNNVEKQMDNMTTEKKKGVITIGGYEIKIKTLIIIGIIIGVLLAFQTANQHAKQKEQAAAAAAEAEANSKALEDALNVQAPEFDMDAIIQESLTEEYGVAPEGFEWDYMGNLVPIGTDTSSTVEEITYLFLRSLTILDFTTVEHYSQDSYVKDTYTSYYNADYGITDYYSDFLRKQYKYALTTMTVDRIGDTAVFADGTEYITVYVNILDLSDKDFWREDQQTIFDNMEKFSEEDTDDTKMGQYLYDYIYTAYKEGKVKLKPTEVELVISKNANGGWLITNDRELDAALKYENGVDVANYIQNCYNDYIMEKQINEATQDLVEE